MEHNLNSDFFQFGYYPIVYEKKRKMDFKIELDLGLS